MVNFTKNKVWANTGAKSLTSFVERNKLKLHEAGELLGISGSTVSGYLKEDKMPAVVELAVKYLDNRRKDPDGIKHYVLTIAGEELAIKQVDEFEEITIAGNRYKMVPI